MSLGGGGGGEILNLFKIYLWRHLIFPLVLLTILKKAGQHLNAFIPYAAGVEFGQYEMMQKTWKITETLAHGFSSESTQQELSNEYKHDRV